MQDANVPAEHGGNSENGESETIFGTATAMETVQAESDQLHPANFGQESPQDGDDVDEDTDSELEDGTKKGAGIDMEFEGRTFNGELLR